MSKTTANRSRPGAQGGLSVTFQTIATLFLREKNAPGRDISKEDSAYFIFPLKTPRAGPLFGRVVRSPPLGDTKGTSGPPKRTVREGSGPCGHGPHIQPRAPGRLGPLGSGFWGSLRAWSGRTAVFPSTPPSRQSALLMTRRDTVQVLSSYFCRDRYPEKNLR